MPEGTSLQVKQQGYKVFPVLIYESFLSEVGADYNFASAVSIIAIVVTAAVFLLQKYATNGKSSMMRVSWKLCDGLNEII